jgi:hypothetical protein
VQAVNPVVSAVAGHPVRSGNLILVSRASATYLRPEAPVRTQKPPSVRDKEDFARTDGGITQ